jgi:hypothetical protein
MSLPRTTQDDARENQQISLFDLSPRIGRSNKYNPDADLMCEGVMYAVELKTSDVVKKAVSTARGVTYKKINEWREVPVWIFSQYEKPNKLTGEDYVLFPEQMEEQYKRLEDKIRKGSDKLAGLNDWEAAKKILDESDLDKSILNKLDYAFNHKGCALNDPKIPWRYVVENGTKVTSAEELREVVRKYYE